MVQLVLPVLLGPSVRRGPRVPRVRLALGAIQDRRVLRGFKVRQAMWALRENKVCRAIRVRRAFKVRRDSKVCKGLRGFKVPPGLRALPERD